MNGSDKWRDKAKDYRVFARYFAESGMTGAAHDARKDAEYCQRKASEVKATEANVREEVRA
jgi:hypothetical protein